MDRAKVIQEILYRTWSDGTSTLDTKEGSLGDLCPLSAEAAWNDFESSLTCVTWLSFWRPLRQTARSEARAFPCWSWCGQHGGDAEQVRPLSVPQGWKGVLVWERELEASLEREGHK